MIPDLAPAFRAFALEMGDEAARRRREIELLRARPTDAAQILREELHRQRQYHAVRLWEV